MRHSTRPRERKHVQGYSFLSFVRKFGVKNGTKFKKETTIDLTRTRIADKITLVGKLKSKERAEDDETNETQELCIPPEILQQIIDDLRLF